MVPVRYRVDAVSAGATGRRPQPMTGGHPVTKVERRHAPRALRITIPALLTALLLTVAACGGGDDDDTASGDDTATTAETKPMKECPGEPIKLAAIASLSGVLSLEGTAATDAVEVAVRAVNADCSLGRPLAVEVCDDKSDPNGSTECGRKLSEDGTLALLGGTGVFDNGADTSGLPALYTIGGGTFDHTDPSSYPFASIVPQVFGATTTSKAIGAESTMMVTFESPATAFIVGQGEELAKKLGIEWKTLFFPQDTVDFAPIAAQVVQEDPDSLQFGVTQVEPFLEALAAEGWTPAEKPTLTTSVLTPRTVLEAVGDKAEGLYVMSNQVPPTVDDNEGIKQMHAEYDAAGMDFETASVSSVAFWSAVHCAADVIATLPPEKIETLDSDTLVEAATSQGPVTRPETAPFDLSESAFPDNPALGAFRLFSRMSMPVQYRDGELVPVADFIDVETPFEIDT